MWNPPPAAWSLANPSRAGKFHTAHKLTLMAHPGNGTRTGSPKHYTEMGRLVADAGKRDWEELTAEYGAMLMEGLSVMGTRGKHVNARRVQHLMGYLKKDLSTEDTPKAKQASRNSWASSRTTARGLCR